MSGAATAVMAVAAVAGTAIAYQNGREQKKAAAEANRTAQANAAKAEKQAEMDMNRANQKAADPMSALSAASQAGKAGASGTMLTSPQGVDPNLLDLGKNTLLGG